MANFSDPGFAGLGGPATGSGGGSSFGGFGGASGAGAAGAIGGSFLKSFSTMGEAFEFRNQVQYEIGAIRNNSAMVLASRDSAIRDINTRAKIMSGRAIALAGPSGVRISGSVVNIAADIKAKAAIDRLRVRVQAENQVAMNEYRQQELKRQSKVKTTQAFIQTGVSTFTSAAGAYAGGMGG
jgi:hypothetical protein